MAGKPLKACAGQYWGQVVWKTCDWAACSRCSWEQWEATLVETPQLFGVTSWGLRLLEAAPVACQLQRGGLGVQQCCGASHPRPWTEWRLGWD